MISGSASCECNTKSNGHEECISAYMQFIRIDSSLHTITKIITLSTVSRLNPYVKKIEDYVFEQCLKKLKEKHPLFCQLCHPLFANCFSKFLFIYTINITYKIILLPDCFITSMGKTCIARSLQLIKNIEGSM